MPPTLERPPTAPADTADLQALLRVVEELLAELRDAAAGRHVVAAQSALDSDLGLDSLARMELLLRAERAFAVSLPEDALQRVATVADLQHELQQASAREGGRASSARAAPPPQPASMDRPAAAADGGGSEAPAGAHTLQEVLQWRLQHDGDRTHIVCLHEGEEQVISHRELFAAAAAVAQGLQQAGVAARQCVALMLPTSREYFASYFGVLLAGAIPVPVYPPARASQLAEHLRRHAGILANAQAVALITVPEAKLVARLLQAQVPTLRRVLAADALSAAPADAGDGAAGAWHAAAAARTDDIAFIQYTSGSTGTPKGVALTHANLLANIRAMQKVWRVGPEDVFVSWLPLYHDMGLIGMWLASLYVGAPFVVMSPLAFLGRPRRWLDAITRHRGTLSAGPNFAYELCLKHVSDDELDALDLSSWRLAVNGAEAVRPETVRRFTERFAACGLPADAMTPVYGLAECSLALLFPPLGRQAPVDTVRREPFVREGRAEPAPPGDDAGTLGFVGCGRVLPGHALRLVDDAGREVGERREGRLEFSGPSAAQGYYRNAEASARLRRVDGDGRAWLDSGDRAYRVGEEIFITGRVKDIVIRAGRNLYPDEIEQAVGEVNGIRKGCVAAFGMADAAGGTERLVVLAEVRDPGRTGDAALRDAVANAVHEAIGEPADRIVLAPPHTVLKTSSGKVRRSATRALVESGHLRATPAAAARDWLRLLGRGVAVRAGVLARGAADHLYALWLSIVFVLLAGPAWLGVVSARSPAQAWRRAHRAARWLFRASGTPLVVHGLERLPRGRAVLVANHASYLDGFVLVAALPEPLALVAKEELRSQPLVGRFLTRLGCEFVQREDARRSVQGAERMLARLREGASLGIFPEGTFRAGPGLLPLHLGAFMSAARAGVPVVPVAILGTRQLLPVNRWRPRRAALAVHIDAPIGDAADADAADLFAPAARLREAARRSLVRMTAQQEE